MPYAKIMENILLISWSPKKGNTYRLLSLIADSTWALTETILLKDKNIKDCLWCGFCEKGKWCAIKDDMQEIIQKLSEADIIVLWSPNYFANVSGMTKKFIDRLLPMYHSHSLKNKKLFLVMPGASDDDENRKFLLQGTYGLVDYQEMKLLWAYGCCTEDKAAAEKRMHDIAKQIAEKISE